jgi:hypothetical protein
MYGWHYADLVQLNTCGKLRPVQCDRTMRHVGYRRGLLSQCFSHHYHHGVALYIEELKKELVGRQLDIWRGHDDEGKPLNLPADKLESYRRLWRRQAKTQEGVRQQEPCGCGKATS